VNFCWLLACPHSQTDGFGWEMGGPNKTEMGKKVGNKFLMKFLCNLNENRPEKEGRARDKWKRTRLGRFFNQIYVHIGKSNPISNFIRTFHLPGHFAFAPRRGNKVDVLQLPLIKSVPRYRDSC